MNQIIKIPNIVSKTSSTLLIPRRLQKEVKKNIQAHKGLRRYFHFLANSISGAIGFAENLSSFGKITHQSAGLNLEKYHFRPFLRDWEIMRLFAASRRISITKLFVVLLLCQCYSKKYVKYKMKFKRYKKIKLNQALIFKEDLIYIKIGKLII